MSPGAGSVTLPLSFGSARSMIFVMNGARALLKTIAGKAVDWNAIEVGTCWNWSRTSAWFGTRPDGR